MLACLFNVVFVLSFCFNFVTIVTESSSSGQGTPTQSMETPVPSKETPVPSMETPSPVMETPTSSMENNPPASSTPPKKIGIWLFS